MLTYGTAIPIVTESFPIPVLDYSANVPPVNAVVSLDLSYYSNDDLDWPDFHNGLAAGLRISKGGDEIDSSWIVYNKPDELDSSHAGFLAALGLSGHLKKMIAWHSFHYLTPKHDITSIGLLLGLSAAYLGTMDSKVTKLLCVHIPALLPPHASELNLSTPTQTACLLGIGLLYMNSLHRRTAEVMLHEIGRFNLTGLDGTSSTCGESYSLAAGFSLGFIALGAGDSASGLSDIHIVEVLRQRIHGGKGLRQDPHVADNDKSKQAMSSALFPQYCDATAPGAMVALSLMFLKTNRFDVAEKLSIPETSYLLSHLRPDLLLLRIVCKNLILWDDIHPSQDWIENQIPPFLMATMANEMDKENRNQGSDLDESLRHALYNILAGACLSIGFRFAGSANASAFKCLLHFMDQFINISTLGGMIIKCISGKFIYNSCCVILLVVICCI